VTTPVAVLLLLLLLVLVLLHLPPFPSLLRLRSPACPRLRRTARAATVTALVNYYHSLDRSAEPLLRILTNLLSLHFEAGPSPFPSFLTPHSDRLSQATTWHRSFAPPWRWPFYPRCSPTPSQPSRKRPQLAPHMQAHSPTRRALTSHRPSIRARCRTCPSRSSGGMRTMRELDR
jgi:hypothetical protein